MQVFLTPTHLAIAMEYAQGGDLFNYTLGHRPHGRLAEQQARWIFQQLIIGLDYCHRRVSTARHVHPASICVCKVSHEAMTPSTLASLQIITVTMTATVWQEGSVKPPTAI